VLGTVGTEPRYTEAGTILPQINWAKVPVIKAIGWVENVPGKFHRRDFRSLWQLERGG
jgi:hypothetical protein